MNIQNPIHGTIPFIPNQEQKQILYAVQNFRRVLFKKDRQIGLSCAIENFLLYEATLKQLHIGIFTPSSRSVHNVMKRLKVNVQKNSSFTRNAALLENGSILSVEVFSLNVLISKQFDIVFLDEISFMQDDPVKNVLPSTKKLIASSELDLGLESIKILDSTDIEIFSASKKFSYIGVK